MRRANLIFEPSNITIRMHILQHNADMAAVCLLSWLASLSLFAPNRMSQWKGSLKVIDALPWLSCSVSILHAQTHTYIHVTSTQDVSEQAKASKERMTDERKWLKKETAADLLREHVQFVAKIYSLTEWASPHLCSNSCSCLFFSSTGCTQRCITFTELPKLEKRHRNYKAIESHKSNRRGCLPFNSSDIWTTSWWVQCNALAMRSYYQAIAQASGKEWGIRKRRRQYKRRFNS